MVEVGTKDADGNTTETTTKYGGDDKADERTTKILGPGDAVVSETKWNMSYDPPRITDFEGYTKHPITIYGYNRITGDSDIPHRIQGGSTVSQVPLEQGGTEYKIDAPGKSAEEDYELRFFMG